jgi:uncharacterized protein YkwD
LRATAAACAIAVAVALATASAPWRWDPVSSGEPAASLAERAPERAIGEGAADDALAPGSRRDVASRETALLAALNDERRAAGLDPLASNPVLESVARARSEDMAARSYFGHFGPDGASAFSLLADTEARFTAVGENLAVAPGDSERSVALALFGLMDSPSHRASILDARFTRVGVGAVRDHGGFTIFTVLLGRPSSGP